MTSLAIKNLITAQQRAVKTCPSVGGFPYFAETLRVVGVTWNTWFLPACQALYLTRLGPVMVQETPLLMGMMDIPSFSEEALVQAIRKDQRGESSFPEFLQAVWQAGVIRYDVDFEKRTVAYYGCQGEKYLEAYPQVNLETISPSGGR